MKRLIQMSLVSVVMVVMMSAGASAISLITLQINGVDTTADTLLSHAILAHGYLDASPVPLAAGLYEFEVGLFAKPEGGEPLWESAEPLEVNSGGVLHATIFNIPGRVFYDTTGGLHPATRYLQVKLPSLNKTYPRSPVYSATNAFGASRIFQYRLFETWTSQGAQQVPSQFSGKIYEFLQNRQSDEVVNKLVEEVVKQKMQMEQMQNIIDELKKKAESK